MATLMRSSAIELNDFPEQLGGRYDIWLGYIISRTGAAAWYLPERLTRYRVHASNATSTGGSALARASVYVGERLEADERLADMRPELNEKLATWLMDLAVSLLREGERTGARRAFRRSLGLRPALRPAVGWALSELPGSFAKLVTTR